ncbi:Pimeloyl-ACP methyl ester carboxylesterase [Mucilaginibacter lappiensis]|uniref:Pimeloyl-ACP methyl ester carboxylesterase n=1 Tax=Mucilaginibacter lappiensis TaxID=354630 RepID=A0ABR6PKN2_9SPHI|nr:alpha/beta hydrolase [Mucilaginibacter lappiensis]MBB6110319.1 pimeloyl-ACP methyl ester carboxylesterase [Mucilaginibacter lappiensis]SIR30278.1 Pimeloyl-ACP methyl ester carboxylesterase [Mucilaginibacter lappiensis]
MKSLFYLLTGIFWSLTFTSCNNPSKNSGSNAIDKTAIYDNGVNIAYTDSGKNDTTLLFVHGWCINKSYWTNQTAYFGKKYRVVAIDLPGFGKSGKNRKDWSPMAFSRDVDSVIKQLDLKKVILIGHSMSGDVALQAAVDNPKQVIGLVVVDIFRNVGKVYVQSKQDKIQYAKDIDSLKRYFKKVTFDYFNQELFYKTTSAAVKKRVLHDVATGDTSIAAACMEQMGDFNEIEKLKAAKTKLYLINSDIKPTDTTHLAANKIPFKLLYIHATGHFPMIEKPQEFNTLLDKAIADIKTR